MAPHNLVISSIVGEFAVDTEKLGRQDPYIFFKTGSNELKTSTVKNVGAGTANWTDACTLHGFEPEKTSILEVKVMNSNFMRHDNLIGSGFMDLATLHPFQLTGSHAKVIIPLVDDKNSYVGSLSFLLDACGYVGHGIRIGPSAPTASPKKDSHAAEKHGEDGVEKITTASQTLNLGEKKEKKSGGLFGFGGTKKHNGKASSPSSSD